jgi:hypothetical protein
VISQSFLGKGPSRRALQVSFKCERLFAVAERYRRLDAPRTKFGRVFALSGIVRAQTLLQILGKTNMV